MLKKFPLLLLFGLLAYLGLSYGVVPGSWRLFEHRHPSLATVATRTVTSAGIPGDPLNVGFVGSEDALHRALLAAGWSPADPVTLRTSMRIATASLLHRPYEDAPVSGLYVFGRTQDYAFEQPAGNDPRQRHHVRFWRAGQLDDAGRPLWIGAATFDSRVGFSHTTGQVTHHIAPEIDAERDKVAADLGAAPGVELSWIDDFQPQKSGRNGGGDPYVTDGRLAVLTAPPATQ